MNNLTYRSMRREIVTIFIFTSSRLISSSSLFSCCETSSISNRLLVWYSRSVRNNRRALRCERSIPVSRLPTLASSPLPLWVPTVRLPSVVRGPPTTRRAPHGRSTTSTPRWEPWLHREIGLISYPVRDLFSLSTVHSASTIASRLAINYLKMSFIGSLALVLFVQGVGSGLLVVKALT